MSFERVSRVWTAMTYLLAQKSFILAQCHHVDSMWDWHISMVRHPH